MPVCQVDFSLVGSVFLASENLTFAPELFGAEKVKILLRMNTVINNKRPDNEAKARNMEMITST